MMIAEPRLRFLRTTLIGHMPGWCPPVDVVGPYRAVVLIAEADVRAARVDLRSCVEPGAGALTVALDLSGVSGGVIPILHCAGAQAELARRDGAHWETTLRIADVELWRPHTHGRPALHPAWIAVGASRIELGEVGFRRLAVDRGADGGGFTLYVNGVRLFCRGACWTPPDVVSLQASRADYARELGLMQAAGVNMVRLSGTMVYETAAFHRVCDAMGILVWQDVMMANFDYPSGAAFAGLIRHETETLVRRLQAELVPVV